MPWLLNEKPEMTMFYPPKPWQLFQKLHLKFQQRKENHEYIEELKGSLIKLFQNKHIEYSEMSKSSLKKYMETWFVSIVPKKCIRRKRESIAFQIERLQTIYGRLSAMGMLPPSKEIELNPNLITIAAAKRLSF